MIRWAGREPEGAECDSTGLWVFADVVTCCCRWLPSRGSEDEVERDMFLRWLWSGGPLIQASKPHGHEYKSLLLQI